MEEESSLVLHVVICEKDDSVRKTLSSYIIAFSKELGFHIKIHQYERMSMNPQDIINLCSYMNFVILNVEFNEKGISFCQELLNKNFSLPILLISDETIRVQPFIPLVGTIYIPVDRNLFRKFFHRAVGQLLCERQIQRRQLDIKISKD